MKRIIVAIFFVLNLVLVSFSLKGSKDPTVLFKQLQNCQDSLKSSIFCDLAFIYLDSAGNKSEIFSNKALSYAKKFKNNNDIAYAHIMLGSSQLAKSEYSKALDNYLAALKILKNTHDYYQLHTVCNNIGIVYKFTGEYDLALDYYSNALNYARQANDLQSIVQSLTNIGNIYILREENEKCLSYYKSAIAECDKSKTFITDIPTIYNNIGYVYFIEKNYPASKLAYTQAYLGFDSLNNTYGQAVVLNNLAEIEILTGNYLLAESYISSADSLHKQMGYNDSRNNLYFTTYQLYLK